MLSLWSRYGNGQLAVVDQSMNVSLSVDRVGDDRFFLAWQGDGTMVPYDRTDCSTFVTIEMCGDPFRVPVACTVDKPSAVLAIEFIVRHGARDPKLHWALMDSIPFAAGWYDA
jgi:hypothetical protein